MPGIARAICRELGAMYRCLVDKMQGMAGSIGSLDDYDLRSLVNSDNGSVHGTHNIVVGE
jgi:hypothetical protein